MSNPNRKQRGTAKTASERMQALRARKIEAGYKDVRVLLPGEYKKLLNQFTSATQLTLSEFLCYLLGCARDGKTPQVDKPIDLNL